MVAGSFGWPARICLTEENCPYYRPQATVLEPLITGNGNSLTLLCSNYYLNLTLIVRELRTGPEYH